MLTLSQFRSLAAGFTCMLIYGSAYTYGTLIPFVTSYLYHAGDLQISANSMAVLLPVSIIVLNLGMPLCNIPQLQFSNRITTLISIIGVCASVFLLSFGDAFWLYVVLYGIVFGLFIGFGYLAPIKNCYQHIPDRKGLCSGVCILGYGISSLLFNMILIALINPNDQHPDELDDGRKIYKKDVSDNVPFALQIMSGVYLAIGMIGIALMTPPKHEPVPVTYGDNLEQSLISVEQNTTKPALLQDSQKKQTLSELVSYLLDKKIIWQVLTLTTSIPFGMFIAFNYKEYGMTKMSGNDSFLTVIGSIGAVFNGVGRFFWGLMFDKFSFRVISSIINIVLLICALVIPFLLQNQYLYLIGVSIIYFHYGGNYSIYPTNTVRIFGHALGSKVYYIVFTGFSFGCLIQWIARLVLVPEKDKEDGFKTCFYIFAGLNLISVLLSIFMKYDYVEGKSVKNEKQDK